MCVCGGGGVGNGVQSNSPVTQNFIFMGNV